MTFDPKALAGRRWGRRYQQDYRPTLGRDGKKESGTLEVVKFYRDGRLRFEQHCYGEAAALVFGVWGRMDPDGALFWEQPRPGRYWDPAVLPRRLDRVDEAGWLYFDGGRFPWKLADEFDADPLCGYPRWKVLALKLVGRGR